VTSGLKQNMIEIVVPLERQTGSVPGVGYVTQRRERETYVDSAGVERHKSGGRMPKKDDEKEDN
jgi:hypothetical protein